MHHMLITLIPQLTKHTVLLMPVALHLRAICQLGQVTPEGFAGTSTDGSIKAMCAPPMVLS